MAKELQDDEQAQNDLNIKLKGQTWYQQFLRSAGQNPNKVKLSDEQRKQLATVAAQNGLTLPAGVGFDPSGNVNERHGFAGQPGWAKALEIGGALAPVAAFAAPALLGAGGAFGASAPAATEAGIFGSAGAGAGAGIGTTGVLGSLAAGGSTLSKVAGILNAGGKAIGAGVSAAAQNRLEADRAAHDAFSSNIVDKARQEAADTAQQTADRKTLYRASVAANPQASPYNPRGVPALSPDLLSGLSDMEKQALSRIQNPAAPFTPYTPKQPSTLETVGNWASPVMSTIGTISKLFG